MKLSTVYARFYKSFNVDHVRKASGAAPKGDWEMFEGKWHPYVEVSIDNRITTIVGANESGKSQLLSAIEKAVTGEGFSQRDLCRYCDFFGVERDKVAWPHLGVAWIDLTAEEAAAVAEAAGTSAEGVSHFMMFREGPDHLTLWLPRANGQWISQVLAPSAAEAFTRNWLPRPYRIHSNIALPDAVPLAWLQHGDAAGTPTTNRRERADLFAGALAVRSYWPAEPSALQTHAGPIFQALNPFIRSGKAKPDEAEARALELARSLLIDLSRVEPTRFGDLAEAIADGDEGFANGITERINAQLEKHLNFRKWWVQDRDFSLRVTPREHELVFTIRDRTGTEYTFGERSNGLRYFLSYLIQSQAHRPVARRETIMLMDEPDTYLSAEAQQDLMRIFADLVVPQAERPPVQVVYVTHSPFLLDKNHGERIRVLEKGKNQDGTRVISTVSRNHYEPLRSAFGAFVGETAFIGSVNLLVEGVTDQVLLAGAATALRNRGGVPDRETLDLNRLVVVPCGSAGQVPYMVYIVRGRDTEKPPIVALLDSDGAGNAAAEVMRKDKRFKALLPKDQVLQLGDLGLESDTGPVREIEDVIPLILATAAVNDCIEEVTRFRTGPGPTITADEITAARNGGTQWDAICAVAQAKGGHIEKLAFARMIVERCVDPRSNDIADAVGLYLDRMRKLFAALNTARRNAEHAANVEKLSSLIDRQQRTFVRDHPEDATKEQGVTLLEDIARLLDASIEAEAIRRGLTAIRRDFRLDDDLLAPIAPYDAFRERLGGLKVALEAERLAAASPAANDAVPTGLAPGASEGEAADEDETSAG